MSDRRPWATVVVPTFGRPAYLAEAVASILDQPRADLECIVVDDASPEPAAVPADPRVRIVRRAKNGGPAAARNTGLDAATGQVILFLDDDDLWTAKRLELAAEGLQRAPIAICWTSFVDDIASPGTGRVLEGDIRHTVLDGLTPALGATAVRRGCALRFTEGMDNLEDVDWWWRAAQAHEVATVTEVGHRYRRHDGPRDRTGLVARVDANVAFLAAHDEWFGAHPRAAAFRWRRVGLLAKTVGDGRLAKEAFARSLRLHPRAATAVHLARAVSGR